MGGSGSGRKAWVHADQQVEEWNRDRLRAEEGRWFKERQWCRCRRPVEGPSYLKHRSCRVCGKLHEKRRP